MPSVPFISLRKSLRLQLPGPFLPYLIGWSRDLTHQTHHTLVTRTTRTISTRTSTLLYSTYDPSIVLPALSHPQPVRASVRPSAPFTLLPLTSYLTGGALPYLTLPYPSPKLLPSYLLRYYSLTTRLLAIFSRIPIFPIYPTTATTLSLHTVNTRNRIFENSLSTTQTTPSHAYYTQITQYPIFPRIHYALGISLIYRFHRPAAPLRLYTTHLSDLRQSHCRPR